MFIHVASASDEQESSDDEDFNEADDMKDSQDPAGADAGGDAAKVCVSTHPHMHVHTHVFSLARTCTHTTHTEHNPCKFNSIK